MNQDQKLSPKYWVVHDKTTEDVLLGTASKSFDSTMEKGYIAVGNKLYDEENYEVILIEIKQVEPK